MNSPFEQALIEVWRQVLVENADVVELGRERYPIGQTPNHHLREVDCGPPYFFGYPTD
jgi:hypothetical protein